MVKQRLKYSDRNNPSWNQTPFHTANFVFLFFCLENAIPLPTKTNLYGPRHSVRNVKFHRQSVTADPVDICSTFFRSWLSQCFLQKFSVLVLVFHVPVWPARIGDSHQLKKVSCSSLFWTVERYLFHSWDHFFDNVNFWIEKNSLLKSRIQSMWLNLLYLSIFRC